MFKNKILLPKKNNENILNDYANKLQVSPLLIDVLLKKGLTDCDKMEEFLYGKKEPFYDPFLLKDMDITIDRIIKAINNKEKITIYGDYDVDGVTSASLLYLFFKDYTDEVYVYIPHRDKEGYGLNIKALQKIRDNGTTLLITVDCGISNYDEIEEGKRFLDIIVTDHHTPPLKLPNAFSIVNPHRIDSNYPFENLAGVGVAYKICQALFEKNGGNKELLRKLIVFPAIGTVADIVPLKDENREIVKIGLKELQKTKIPGLISLINLIQKDEIINSETIGFGIGPRINAAGRIAHATLAVELLITNDNNKANEIALELDEKNNERKELSAKVLKEAEEMLAKQEKIEGAIVLAHANWHSGVIGIVASRLVDKYHLPTILLTKCDGFYKGSCRSIPALNMYKMIDSLKELLIQYGGHSQAAGLSLMNDNFDVFKKKILEYTKDKLTDLDYHPNVTGDIIIGDNNKIDVKLIKQFSLLEPYGESNKRPKFIFKNALFKEVKLMGKDRNHLSFSVQNGNNVYKAIVWNKGELINHFYKESKGLVLFYPKINYWRNIESVNLFLEKVNLDYNIIDYRNTFLKKEVLFNKIVNDSNKTLVVANNNVAFTNKNIDFCNCNEYNQFLNYEKYKNVIIYDLPTYDIFNKRYDLIYKNSNQFIYLLYTENDYKNILNKLANNCLNRKNLISIYKFIKKEENKMVKTTVSFLEDNFDKELVKNALLIFEELDFLKFENGNIELCIEKSNPLENSKLYQKLKKENEYLRDIIKFNYIIQIKDIIK